MVFCALPCSFAFLVSKWEKQSWKENKNHSCSYMQCIGKRERKIEFFFTYWWLDMELPESLIRNHQRRSYRCQWKINTQLLDHSCSYKQLQNHWQTPRRKLVNLLYEHLWQGTCGVVGKDLNLQAICKLLEQEFQTKMFLYNLDSWQESRKIGWWRVLFDLGSET